MKKLFILTIITFLASTSYSQYAVENIFRKYRNDQNVVNWQFSGDLTKYFSRNDGEKLKSTLENLDFYMFSDGDISAKDAKKLTDAIKNDEFELLIQARDEGKKIKIYGIESEGVISKIHAQINAEEMKMYFFLRGNIFLEDLNNIEMSDLMENAITNWD